MTLQKVSQLTRPDTNIVSIDTLYELNLIVSIDVVLSQTIFRNQDTLHLAE